MIKEDDVRHDLVLHELVVGMKIARLELHDSSYAVKVNVFNDKNEQLYAIYKNNIYQRILLNIHEVRLNKKFNNSN